MQSLFYRDQGHGSGNAGLAGNVQRFCTAAPLPHLVTCCYQEGLAATGRIAENMLRTPAPMFERPQEARQRPGQGARSTSSEPSRMTINGSAARFRNVCRAMPESFGHGR